MIDNKKVKETHQEGIERVKQKSGDMKKGQGGKMGMVKEKANWKRSDQMTPCKA